MQNSDGIKKIKNACGVNEPVCTMYAVSITPDAGFSQKLLQNEHFHQNLKNHFRNFNPTQIPFSMKYILLPL
jgi:hypothetical protein